MHHEPQRAHCAALLDTIAHSTRCSEVAIHALAAAQALGASAAPAPAAGNADDRAALDQVLRLLAAMIGEDGDDNVIDATHHTLLAHIAAR